MSGMMLVALFILPAVLAKCPFSETTDMGDARWIRSPHHLHRPDEYLNALNKIDIQAVQADITKLLHSSDPYWPSDYGNYGPFFIRLAWHTSGSYRTSDGRGGVDGGRQRFEPEMSWDDNTNLDKARHLLWPIKEKYGLGLSWGDLFILTGNTAIQEMGGPVLGFCAGRMDDKDGAASIALGPSKEQEIIAPCEVNGECESPLGTTTVGLIYVNPEGPMGNPIPKDSAPQIRDTFSRMSMNDTETVALIGGGHAFGKTHGACPAGAGPSPKEDPANPWPGLCGTGKGNDTFTSGFEGPWTSQPTKFDNEYFRNLLDFDWTVAKGSGGHYQWSPNAKEGSGKTPPSVMMLTSDVSLLEDELYKSIVKKFADDPEYFADQFKHAWYKLTTRDMGPWSRCHGNMVPPPQEFQFPLPPPPQTLPNFDDVKKNLQKIIVTPNYKVIAPDDGSSYAPLFVRLAWQCANTFRQTDYQGGCNGARLRLEPEISWPANKALDQALQLLKPVKDQYGADLTWADLIVLAGTTSLEMSSGCDNFKIPFKGGRSDADPKKGPVTPDYLQFKPQGGASTDTIDAMENAMYILGLNTREWVALMGGGHTLGRQHKDRSGFNDGQFTSTPLALNNEYFKNLVDLTWTKVEGSATGHEEYTAKTKSGQVVSVLKTDMMLTWNSAYKAVVEEYVQDEEKFMKDFSNVWMKVMNSDMF